MSAIRMSTKIARAPDAVSRVFEGRAVVISLDAGRIRTLNPTATAVWELLATGARSFAELVESVVAIHPVEARDTIETDVRTFVADLVARQLASAVDP